MIRRTPANDFAGVLSFLSGFLGDDASWKKQAHCISADPNLFYSEPREPLYPSEEVLSYCYPCPVRRQCLDHALNKNEQGVWGATTEYQRRLLRSVRPRKRCPVCRDDVIVPSRRQYEICIACGHSWRTSK